MRVLVTGGSGFIGTTLCRHLVEACAWTVINADKLTYAAAHKGPGPLAGHPRYHFHQIDICDRPALDAVIALHEPDAVLNLAAETHVDRSITGPSAFITTNVVGTSVLLEAARAYWTSLKVERRDAFRFLHLSTDEVFGSAAPEILFSETSPYAPASPYSASKAASDHLVLAWHRTYGLPVLLANASNTYGPYQFPEKLMPLMITNALLGRDLPVYGQGQNVRDWIYVEDHARALAAILTRGSVGERYNIGARNEQTNIAVVEAICGSLDRLRPRADGKPHAAAIRYVSDRPGHDLRYAIDPTKLERETGWQPAEAFSSGLDKTIRWYLDNVSWWQAVRASLYCGERLGLIT